MRFSALQRAENSSIARRDCRHHRRDRFQCSSASRKFLNRHYAGLRCTVKSFSALQRAENSSIDTGDTGDTGDLVSVLFSEPKIPQLGVVAAAARFVQGFSALQRAENSSIEEYGLVEVEGEGFSALQRAENSSIKRVLQIVDAPRRFQCSSASRKFLNTPSSVISSAP